ncbi:hypothetical protein OUZ56_021989 [Daphnia magna]|uniref:Uncharacterized protein n=1 Tax=Daphnia magna TaxID=35525 RepID=A0ABR0AV21_9CRUS|nr:hypothetical protein OUZ56_021989 [Daphnia magna]
MDRTGNLEYLQWLRVLFGTTADSYSFVIDLFDNCKVSLFFMYFKPFVPALYRLRLCTVYGSSSLRQLFASFPFRRQFLHRLIAAFALVSSPPSPSSHRHLRPRLIATFALVSSPPSPSSHRHPGLCHRFIAIFAFVVSPSFATMDQSDPENKTNLWRLSVTSPWNFSGTERTALPHGHGVGQCSAARRLGNAPVGNSLCSMR